MEDWYDAGITEGWHNAGIMEDWHYGGLSAKGYGGLERQILRSCWYSNESPKLVTKFFF